MPVADAALPPGGQPGRGPRRRRRGPLRHRLRRGQAAAAAGPPRPASTAWSGGPVAGKTGTTDDTRAAWFVGFTPELAVAGFMADPDNPFHAVGDGNAWKPIETVAYTLRDSLKGKARAALHAAVRQDPRQEAGEPAEDKKKKN